MDRPRASLASGISLIKFTIHQPQPFLGWDALSFAGYIGHGRTAYGRRKVPSHAPILRPLGPGLKALRSRPRGAAIIAAMGYQITSKVLVGMGRAEAATERMTDEVWAEILQRTDIVRLADERELDWPELALGRREQAEIPQPLANTLADALEDMYVSQDIRDYVWDGGSLDQFTARRVIDILRAGGVTLARIASPLAGDDAPPMP